MISCWFIQKTKSGKDLRIIAQILYCVLSKHYAITLSEYMMSTCEILVLELIFCRWKLNSNTSRRDQKLLWFVPLLIMRNVSYLILLIKLDAELTRLYVFALITSKVTWLLYGLIKLKIVI